MTARQELHPHTDVVQILALQDPWIRAAVMWDIPVVEYQADPAVADLEAGDPFLVEAASRVEIAGDEELALAESFSVRRNTSM